VSAALFVVLVFLYVIVCLFLILVVLLQQGKGADLAGAFGGAGTQTSFGPRSSTNIMHRLTTGSFVLFVVLSMTLAVLQSKSRGHSAMESVPTGPPPAAGQPSPGTPAQPSGEAPQQAAGEAAPKPAAEAPAGEAPAHPSAEAPASAPEQGQTPPQ
jgi:preprotein translocase subunit SecG